MSTMRLNHVSLKIGNAEILNDITFELNKKEIIGLVGANGAGKSSTIKLITRFYVPGQGEIMLNDKNISTIKREHYPVSYIPDEPIFYDFMTVEEHLVFVDSLYTSKKCYTISELIKILELEPHLHKTPGMLSKGTKQKLMIALALVREYELLVADEPFSGLDPEQIVVLKNILLRQKECGKTVLVSAHQLNLIESICDKYIIIDNGEIIADGTKKELLKKFAFECDMPLEECYLSIVKNRREFNAVPD